MYLHQKSNKATCWIATGTRLTETFSTRNYVADNGNWFRPFWGFYSTYFCNFLDKSQAICLENCKNMSRKNTQNDLNQFHCQTTKFLVENGFRSAHSGRYPTNTHTNIYGFLRFVKKNHGIFQHFATISWTKKLPVLNQ